MARSWRGRRAATGAFTLVETILVLAVMVLLGTLLLPSVNSILRAINQEDPQRQFWDTVTAARELALTQNRTVLLRLSEDRKTLLWGDASDRQQKLPAGVSLKFLRSKTGSTILLGGTLLETEELPVVRFYADGTCDRFRAQIMSGKSSVQIMTVDPWTCAATVETDRKP